MKEGRGRILNIVYCHCVISPSNLFHHRSTKERGRQYSSGDELYWLHKSSSMCFVPHSICFQLKTGSSSISFGTVSSSETPYINCLFGKVQSRRVNEREWLPKRVFHFRWTSIVIRLKRDSSHNSNPFMGDRKRVLLCNGGDRQTTWKEDNLRWSLAYLCH